MPSRNSEVDGWMDGSFGAKDQIGEESRRESSDFNPQRFEVPAVKDRKVPGQHWGARCTFEDAL